MAKVIITIEDNADTDTYQISAKYEPELIDEDATLTKAQAMAEILLHHAAEIMISGCDIHELLSRMK